MGADVSTQLRELPLDLEEPGEPLDNGRISVTVVSAENVYKGKLEIGGSDVYAVLQLDDQEFRTSVIKGKKPKEWKETHDFDVEDDDTVIMLGLWDKDRFTKDDLLGAFPIPLSTFADQEVHEVSYKTVLGNPKPDEAATVNLIVQYTSKERINTIKIENLPERSDKVVLEDNFPEFRRCTFVSSEDGETKIAFIELREEDDKEKALSKDGKNIDGNDVIVTDADRSVREMIQIEEDRKEAEEAAELEALQKQLEEQKAASEELAAEMKRKEELEAKKAAAAKKKADAAAKRKAAAAAKKKRAAKKKQPSMLGKASKKARNNLAKGKGFMKKLF